MLRLIVAAVFYDSRRIKNAARKNYSILVIRINAEGMLVNSKPCNDCIISLLRMGVNKVYYSNEKGHIICEKLAHMNRTYICKSKQIQRFSVKKIKDIPNVC